MARPSSKDPLDKFRWAVSIDGFSRLGFSSVEVPSMSIKTTSFAEGGNHMFPKQIVDSVEYKPVTLTRGVTSDRSFHEWAIGCINILLDRDIRRVTNVEEVGEYRRDITIDHLDRAGRVVRSYKLYNAFPIEYTPASDFLADGDDTYSMEKLVLTYESFEVVTNGQDDNPFSIKDITKRLLRRAF